MNEFCELRNFSNITKLSKYLEELSFDSVKKLKKKQFLN